MSDIELSGACADLISDFRTKYLNKSLSSVAWEMLSVMFRRPETSVTPFHKTRDAVLTKCTADFPGFTPEQRVEILNRMLKPDNGSSDSSDNVGTDDLDTRLRKLAPYVVNGAKFGASTLTDGTTVAEEISREGSKLLGFFCHLARQRNL